MTNKSDEAKNGVGKEPAPKRPVGRPSKYDPDIHIPMLEEILGTGLSFLQFCAKAGICRDTGYEWIKSFPEFSDSYTRMKTRGEAIWERRVEEMLYDSKVNAPLVKLYMANRFGWTDKVQTEHSGKVEGLSINIDLGEK